MLTKEHRRRDDGRRPIDARQQSTGGREECAVGGRERRSRDLAPQDAELMAEHHDLEFFELGWPKRSIKSCRTRSCPC